MPSASSHLIEPSDQARGGQRSLPPAARLTLLLILGWLGALAVPVHAQVARPSQATVSSDSLLAQLRRLTARLDLLEAGTCTSPVDTVNLPEPEPTGVATTDSLARQLWRLEGRVRVMMLRACSRTRSDTAAAEESGIEDLAALRAAAAAATGAVESDTTAASGPVQFIGKQRSGNALNPEISATANLHFAVESGPGPQTDNAVAREFEFSFQSVLDPYSHTKVFLSASEEGVGVEEGYIYWIGLPGNTRLDAGKIRQQVGELNRWHLHALPETDYPLVYQRYLGEEGLAAVGLSLYTALPVSIGGGTHEAWLQGTSAESDPLFGESHQPTLLGRILNFWQLSRSTFFQAGLTGLGGDNSDQDLQSRLVGVDFRLTVRPPNAGTRREFTVRGEGYRLHSVQDGVPTNRYGAFVAAQFRVNARVVLGTRYDWVEAARGAYAREWQVVPALTWWQSEWVYLRLEGRHGRLAGEGMSQLVAQVVWAMGPHKHEVY